MGEITAQAVKAFRERTGLPLMDCKRALTEANGDEQLAIDMLRKAGEKLEAKRVSAEHVLTGGGSSQSEKTKSQKRIDWRRNFVSPVEIRKALEELSTWERDVVRPLAEKRIELDLDDGVKVNYEKLGAILAKVKGLNA